MLGFELCLTESLPENSMFDPKNVLVVVEPGGECLDSRNMHRELEILSRIAYQEYPIAMHLRFPVILAYSRQKLVLDARISACCVFHIMYHQTIDVNTGPLLYQRI
jgi:hypothetical protein